jgi:DnaK suppressor protein
MRIDAKKYRALLNAKAGELIQGLRTRGRITMENSAEELEQILLKDEREFAMLAIDRDTQMLREVRFALARLDDGTFGVCEECDCDIPIKRLEAVPWARRCVSCQEATDRAAPASTFRPLQFAA